MKLLYCNVDNEGNITESIMGHYVVPDKKYDFVFTVDDDEQAPEDYKVELNGFKSSLVPKDNAV